MTFREPGAAHKRIRRLAGNCSLASDAFVNTGFRTNCVSGTALWVDPVQGKWCAREAIISSRIWNYGQHSPLQGGIPR